MRITNNMMTANMMRNLNRSLVRMDKWSMQVMGKRINKPSDDPIAAARTLGLRADISELNQFKNNVNDTVSWLETTELAIKNTGAVLERLRELTTEAANGVLTEEETKKVLEEVKELKQQIIDIGNTTYSGKYIFSGKKTGEKLFEVDADGKVTYNDKLGKLTNYKDPKLVDDKMVFKVGTIESIEVNVLGYELFGGETLETTGDERWEVKGGDSVGIIGLIEDIEAKLEAGDTAGLTNNLEEIDQYEDRCLTVRSEIGAKMNRMKLVKNRIEDDSLNLTDLKSELEDADPAEAIMKLMMEANAYRASLAVGARIIQPSLVDFLR